MAELKTGLKGRAEVAVTHENTAAVMGSGALEVFATPAMVALMEKAALESVQPCLEEGQGTVGTRLEISHLAATPVGMTVRAEAEVTAVEGKVITFAVRAFDEAGEIGSGTHTRVIVNSQKFLEKAYAKL